MHSRDRLPEGKGLEGVMYSGAPALLLLAGESERLDRARCAAALCGFRVVAEDSVERGEERICATAAFDAVLVAAGQGEGEALRRLVPRLDAAARIGGFRTVMAAPRGMLEPIGVESLHHDIYCVCGHREADAGLDLMLALQASAVSRPARVQDVKGSETPRLQQLSKEVGRIATILASLSEEDEGGEADAHHGPPIDSALVRAIIRARRLRDHYFQSALFADPAWDMLLDLYASRLERRRVAVSSLCIAAAVPATTALRWIKSLTDQGLFVRVADHQDGRRVFIELSDEAAGGLETYLKAAQRISPIIA